MNINKHTAALAITLPTIVIGKERLCLVLTTGGVLQEGIAGCGSPPSPRTSVCACVIYVCVSVCVCWDSLDHASHVPQLMHDS